MFVAAFGVSVSLTLTFVFLLFYSNSKAYHGLLEALDYMGKLIWVYFYAFAFISIEMVGTRTQFLFSVFVVLMLALNLVMLQYEFGRKLTFFISLGVLLFIGLYDFFANATIGQKKIFYIPIFVEFLILGVGYLCYIFEFPQQFFPNAKFFQIYFSGWIIFTLCLINFIYESYVILYYTIKWNRGNYNIEEDDWWKQSNLFYRD